LLYLDLDNFKAINDNLGHYAGDLLLKEVTKRLLSCLRAEDFLARIGGDEFVVILSHIIGPKIAGNVAKKIIEVLAQPYNLAGNNVNISSSIGITCYPSVDANQETLMQSADIAMYHAKESGRSNYQYFTKELHDKHKQKAILENSLRHALEEHE